MSTRPDCDQLCRIQDFEGWARLLKPIRDEPHQQRRRRVQSRKCHSARRYGRERALLGRSLLNFMRIARDAHTPDLTLGEVGDLLFTAIEVFIGHAFGRPMVISELSRNLEMPRDAVRRKLQRLLEIGLVERIDHHYYMTAKANTPLQREVLLAHLRNMQSAITEVTKMDPAGLQR